MFIVFAGFLGLSLFAPMVALADEGLVPGQSAAVQTGGGDVSLRSDPSSDAQVLSSVSDGTAVSILEGPVAGPDGSLWYFTSANGLTGYIAADMVAGDAVSTPPESTDTIADAADAPEDPAAAESAGQAVAAPSIPWKEPVDVGVVVDNVDEPLPADGLACRVDARTDADVVVRLSAGNTLEVTGAEVWVEGVAFLPVNCAGAGGFVRGDFVQLNSEAAGADEPEASTEEESTDEVVTEEPVTEEIATEDVVAEEEVEADVEATEEIVAEEPVTEEPVVEEEIVDEPEVAAEDTTDEAVAEEGTTGEIAAEVEATEVVSVEAEADADESVTTDEAATEAVPVEEEEAETELATEEGAVPEDDTARQAPAEEVAAEEPAASPDAATEETAAETGVPAEVVVEDDTAEQVSAEEVTGEEPATPAAAEVTEEVATEETSAEEVNPEPVAAEEVAAEQAETEADTTDAGAQPNQQVATAQQAQSQIDPSRVIGTAEVVNTNGDGVRCRTAASSDAPTITVLAEGTTVQVLSVERNGFLGVICGGQEGFANVDFLWSGGAGDEIAANAGSVTVVGTGSGLNCRSGAGTSFGVITVLRDGTTVSIRGASSNGWVPVVCGGQNGYVSIDYVEAAGTASSGGDGRVSAAGTTMTVTGTNGDGVRCRTAANTSASIITVLAEGTRVSTRGGASGGWVPVVCDGVNGYVSAQYLGSGSGSTTGSSPVTGSATVSGTNGAGVRCRATASTSGNIIAVLAEGTRVSTRGAASGGWVPVVCGGANGYVSAQYLTIGGSGSTPTPTSPPATSGMVNGDHARVTDTLNLRYSASMGAGIATTAPAGTVVLITGGVTNGFYPVDWDGLRGFMSKDYLVKTSAALSERGGSGDTSAPPPVSDNGGTATGNSMANFALRYEGYPYVWGTSGPSSFDCSGFTYWVTKNVTGKDIGTGLWTQVSAGTPVSRANLQPGDLIFFQNTYKAGLSHSGIYIGNNRFIHAENETTGVRISDLNSTYYSSRWYGAVRMT
jgi:cell wall-associated NlpC family hydrolase